MKNKRDREIGKRDNQYINGRDVGLPLKSRRYNNGHIGIEAASATTPLSPILSTI